MNQLTKKIAFKTLQDFFEKQKPFILFGTGTSCAIDQRFGMDALRDHLLINIRSHKLENDLRKEWDQVKESLESGNDLESALKAVNNNKLIVFIVESTAKLLVPMNSEIEQKIRTGSTPWPAIKLFKKMVGGLSGSDKALYVATTNYDLLAEFAFEQSRIPFITGFSGQICRYQDWKRANLSVKCQVNEQVSRGKMRRFYKELKHIKLYKVHGSLNTFRFRGSIIENNQWMSTSFPGIERMMIAPGPKKNEQLHQNRSELLSEYDRAVEKHDAFLFLGFGFNDDQLNNDSIKRKLKDQKCEGIVITRDLNDRIFNLAKECENLWLVCKNNVSKIDGTRIYNAKYRDWFFLDNEKLWNFNDFSEIILGG